MSLAKLHGIKDYFLEINIAPIYQENYERFSIEKEFFN